MTVETIQTKPLFSIKNDRVARLLETITRLTGEGNTEASIYALEFYQASLLREGDAQRAVEAIKKTVHPQLLLGYRGRALSKAEVEEALELR